MLLHCTQVLAKKLTSHPAPDVAQPEWLHWHAHLLRIDRRQCVMFSHDQTRYCLFVAGLRAPQFEELGRWHRELFTAALATDGIPDAVIAKAELALGPMAVDSKTDRSVLGGIRIAAQDLEYGIMSRISHVLMLDPLKVTHWLNQRPVTVYGKFIHPDEQMRESLAKL